MKLLDANLLLYAHTEDLPQHAATRAWIERCFADGDVFGLAWPAVVAFLRLCTQKGVLLRPSTIEAATAMIDGWFASPQVTLVAPGPRHWSLLRHLLAAGQGTGNLVPDAHLAALALELDATLCTNDHGIARFPGVRLAFPLMSDSGY